MADRKLELNISADASQLKNDLTALSTQLTQLSKLATAFNTALTGNGIGSGLSSLTEQFQQLATISGGFSAKLNSDLLKAAIAQNTLTAAEIKQAKVILDTTAKQEKAAQATANRQSAEEKLAQAQAKSATQQQADAAKVAIAQQNLLKATAQREAVEQRLAKTSEQSNKIQAEGAAGLLRGLQANLFAINNLRFGIQSFGFIANGIFQSLVGSSIQLEQQLISIRGALAATNDITSGGKSISDPLERINKLAPSVNKAIAQVRKDSLELANVTSDGLIGVFQIISGEVGNIGANLDDAAKLTKAFGSSFSALGLPLYGARQEITSILQGTIDQNSALAKTLAINNTQIQQEKAKGTLVEFLLRKTEALAASQGLVAKTFGGVSSNILEVFQRLQESFGKVVLPPIVEQLTKIYNSLLAAQPQIETFISNLSKGFVEIFSNVKLVFDAVLPLFIEFGKTLGAIATASLPVLQAGFTLFLGTAIAVANTLTAVLTPILQAIQSDFGKFVVTVGLAAIAFDKLGIAIIASKAIFAGLTATLTSFSFSGLIAGFTNLAIGIDLATFATTKFQSALIVTASIAALGATLVAAAFAWNQYSQAVEASRQTTQAWKNSTDSTGLIVGKFTKRLQELRDQLKAGTITPEGRRQLEDYKRYLSDAAKEIPSKIKDIQDAVEKNGFALINGIKFNKEEANQQIERLKQFQQEALGTLDETAILGQKAINQGTLKAQFNTVSKNYFNEFRKGTQLAVGQAKQFIGVIQQEIELGFISKEEGLKRLKALSQGEFLLKEDRVAAAKAATAIVDTETKKQTALIQAFQAETQLLIKGGSLSEIDGIKKLGELKAQEKQAEIDGIDEKLKFVVKGSELERDLITQRKKAIADLRKSELDFIQEQVAALRSGLDRELSANADLRKKAEQATQADILALKIGGFENDRQLEEQSLLQKQRNIESELFDKRRVLEFDKTNLANFVGSQKEKEELILKIGNQEAEIAKLNLEATDNLIARNKLLYEQKINNLEIEKTTTDRVTKLLESQNSLLTAQVKLQGAIADARLKGAENQLTVLKEADGILKANRDKASAEEQKRRDAQRAQILSGLDEEKRKKQELLFAEEDAAAEQQKAAKDGAIAREKERLTRERLAALGISAGTNELAIARQIFDQEQKILELKARKFEQDQANARRELEISIQQSQIRDKQLQVEAQIALIKAKASGSNEAIKSALELVALTDEQVKNNKQIGDIQRQTLATTQGAELATFNQEQQGAQFKNKIAGAESGLVGLQSSDGVVARSLALNPEAIAKEAEARKKLADAKDPAKVKAIQEQRKQDLASVADGAVAFENTSQQIADNFASLPNSLKATKDGLKEVIAQSKELAENPVIKSREQQAAKQQQAEQTQITNRLDGGLIEIKTGAEAQELIKREQARREKDKQEAIAYRKRLGFFTGGLPPVGEPVTVNERGQEAVTNLQTLETSLLPNGERTVQFDAPTWVHNASETKQLGSLGVFDSNQLPNINFGAIASALRINNSDIVRELRTLRSELAASMSRPNLINNFSNDPRPDLTAYRLQNQLLRV